MAGISYKFSSREKIMLGILIVAALLVAWYMLIFQGTAGEVEKLNKQIETIQTDIDTANAQVAKMKQMEKKIAELDESGAEARVVPDYDNTSRLMAELNRVMESALSYNFDFANPDVQSSPDYVMRDVTITYSTDTIEQAEEIANMLENGRFPCQITSIAFTDGKTKGKNSSRAFRVSNAGNVGAVVHATFFEKQTDESKAESDAQKKEKEAKEAKKNANSNTNTTTK